MEYEEDVMKRLRRIEGQIRGVMKMMQEKKECKEVVTQLSAVRGATDRVIAYITAVNLEKCILAEQELGGDTRKIVQDAVDLLMKSK
jgi:DNA-binding FrmR family transcriptional regulator